MGHGFYKPTPFKRSSHQITTQDGQCFFFFVPNLGLGHDMLVPNSKLGKGTSAPSPTTGQERVPPNSTLDHGISAPNPTMGQGCVPAQPPIESATQPPQLHVGRWRVRP